MAYHAEIFTSKSPSFMLTTIRDLLVNDCGWTDETPSGQDDELHCAIGYFLRSNGEAGNSDLCAHLKLLGSVGSGETPVQYSYLSADITSTTQMSCTVQDGDKFTATPPYNIRIDDELIRVTSRTGNVLTFTQRGYNNTTPATHSTGAQVLAEEHTVGCEIFGVRDLDNYILQTTSGVVVDYDECTIAEFASAGTKRYSCGYVMLKDVSSGKMRLVHAYDTSTGKFEYGPFKSYIGGPNQVQIMSCGFHPCHSVRVATTGETYPYYRENVYPDLLSAIFVYGCKDGFWVLQRDQEKYQNYYFGNYIPFADAEPTTISSAVSSGATAIPVTDRRRFIEGEKYRIISTDAQDWRDNEDRSGESWPDLDPEEGVTEEFVINSITPGSGNEGTLVITAPLRYSYRAGTKPAVVGEDPRPIFRSIGYSYVYNNTNYCCFSQGQGHNGGMCGYHPGPKDNLLAHASHRQSWRTCHESGTPSSPRTARAQVQYMVMNPSYDFNYYGDVSSSIVGAYPNNLTGRYVPSLVEIINSSITQDVMQYGIYQSLRGTLPLVWYVHDSDFVPGGNEDKFESRWLESHQTFNIFDVGVYTGTHFYILGPKIT